MADRAITMPRLVLAPVDRLVELELPTRRQGQLFENQVESARTGHRMNDRRRRDRAGVDHRVVRTVGTRIELDGVEHVAARLDTDALENGLSTDELERQTVNERFRYRLNRERMIGVP